MAVELIPSAFNELGIPSGPDRTTACLRGPESYGLGITLELDGAAASLRGPDSEANEGAITFDPDCTTACLHGLEVCISEDCFVMIFLPLRILSRLLDVSRLCFWSQRYRPSCCSVLY